MAAPAMKNRFPDRKNVQLIKAFVALLIDNTLSTIKRPPMIINGPAKPRLAFEVFSFTALRHFPFSGVMPIFTAFSVTSGPLSPSKNKEVGSPVC